MSSIQRIWTTTADFDTGVYDNAVSVPADEVRKVSDAGVTDHGIWTGTFDAGAGSGRSWTLLTLNYVTVPTSYLYVQYRATDAPTQTGDTWIVAGFSPTTGPWLIDVSSSLHKRYFQAMVFMFPHPQIDASAARLLDATIDGTVFAAGAAPVPVPIPDWIPESGASEQCAARAGAVTCQAS